MFFSDIETNISFGISFLFMIERTYRFQLPEEEERLIKVGKATSGSDLDDFEEGIMERWVYIDPNVEVSVHKEKNRKLYVLYLDSVSWANSRPLRQIEFDEPLDTEFIKYNKEKYRLSIRDSEGELVDLIEEESGEAYKYLDLKKP